MGGAYFYGVSHAPITRGRSPSGTQFRDLFYLCVHPLTKNDQIRRGNTQGEGGLFSEGHPRPGLKGRSPALPNFGGSPFMPTPFHAE